MKQYQRPLTLTLPPSWPATVPAIRRDTLQRLMGVGERRPFGLPRTAVTRPTFGFSGPSMR
jgi:hypothetical protein